MNGQQYFEVMGFRRKRQIRRYVDVNETMEAALAAARITSTRRGVSGIGDLDPTAAAAIDIAADAALCALGPEGAAVAAVLGIFGIKASDIVNFCTNLFGKEPRNARGLTAAGEAAKVFEESYDPSMHDDAYMTDASVNALMGHYNATIGPGLSKKIAEYYYGSAANPGGLKGRREAEANARIAAEAARANALATTRSNAMSSSNLFNRLQDKGLFDQFQGAQTARASNVLFQNLQSSGAFEADGQPPATKNLMKLTTAAPAAAAKTTAPAVPMTTLQKAGVAAGGVAAALSIFALIGKVVR